MRYYGFLLGLTFLQLTACSSGPKLPPLPVDAVVLAYGDSLTYGTGAELNQSYPAILSRLIGRRVVNAGIPGEITAEGLDRLPETLERVKPSLVILCHGANDLMRGMDQRRAADNLRSMLNLIRERGASAVLVSVPEIGLSLSPPQFYAEVAAQAGIPLEPKMLPRILGTRSLKSDIVHPNAAGYRAMAEALADLLRKRGALP
ncbi:MAG: arylesterase [Desulfuromonadales bacterium]|nr:arylesterase [Desulfuromonadales bacterium]